MTAITAQLAAHMESTRLPGGAYAPIASHAGVQAAAGVAAPVGETWRVCTTSDSRGNGWLLERVTASAVCRELGAGPHAELACGWTAREVTP